ncbi:MAG: hypothetical protein ACTSQ4_11700, partial [Candidatus Heimdallarchaeaceae archaeon]
IGNSLRAIRYVMPAVLTVVDVSAGPLQLGVALTVSGVGNRTHKVAYYRQLATPGSYEEVPASISINYVTAELPAGTYVISVYWRSIWDSAGSNALIANNPPNFDYIRSLTVEEIRL